VSEQSREKIESVGVSRGKIESVRAEAEKDREHRSESERLLTFDRVLLRSLLLPVDGQMSGNV